MKNINNRKLDRRCKLSVEEEKDLIYLKEKVTQREAAKLFGVSRRLVQFKWYPKKLQENLLRREERVGTAQYYNKEEHRKHMAEHRAYKKELIKKGLL